MPQTTSPASAFTLKLFRIASLTTGIFLLTITILYVIRLATNQELWALGPNGFLTLETFTMTADGFREGLPQSGLDLTSISLIVHGWLYVLYLYACFRVWTETRWSFLRFLVMAAGGVVPFLSFFTERHYGRLAKGETH
jgi:integral membrane protein